MGVISNTNHFFFGKVPGSQNITKSSTSLQRNNPLKKGRQESSPPLFLQEVMKKRGKIFVGLESCLDAFGGIEQNFRNVCEEIEYVATYYVIFSKADLKSLVKCSERLMVDENGRERHEIERKAAIRAVETVRAIPKLKSSDKKHLAKLIKTARISTRRKERNTKNMEREDEEQEQEQEQGEAMIERLPDEIMREIFSHFRSKTDVAVASCVCARWKRVLSCQKKEKSNWYAALHMDRETGRCTTRDGRLVWETIVKNISNSGVDDEEHVALKSKIEVYTFIRENVRSQRRREIDSDFSDTTSEDDDEDEDDEMKEEVNDDDDADIKKRVISHRFWNVRKYL